MGTVCQTEKIQFYIVIIFLPVIVNQCAAMWKSTCLVKFKEITAETTPCCMQSNFVEISPLLASRCYKFYSYGVTGNSVLGCNENLIASGGSVRTTLQGHTGIGLLHFKLSIDDRLGL